MTDVALQKRDLAVLDALCEDRAECGQGLTRADLERIGDTRWPHRCLRRLREAGHRIASIGTGEESERWQLLDPLPSTGASDDGRSSAEGPPAADASSGVPVEGRLFELAGTPHFDVRAQAA